MAELQELKFTKDWNNPADFPTYEGSEAQVRKDMQQLHDEVRDYLNNVLIPGVKKAIQNAAFENIDDGSITLKMLDCVEEKLNAESGDKLPTSKAVAEYIAEHMAEDKPDQEPETPSIGSASYFGTIGTKWTVDAATGVKYQMVPIEGMLASEGLAVLDVVMTHERTAEGYAAFVEEQNQFLEFISNGDAETVDGGVMFYIYGDANTIEIPFGVEIG